MAIFSLNHSFVGRSTHPAGAAGAYVRYITRSEACTVILGERMPLDRKVYAWLDEQEKSDRKNARVIDRVVVALPAELSRDQNIELLQDFGERMTQGRVPWMAAIHDGPGDTDNPHAHIVFRDRDIETGRRAMLTTEPGSTQRFRQAWEEEEVNKALERAGLEVRVDRRSLADQGIDREPQLHVGAGAQRLADREHEFRSNEKQVTRLIHGTPTEVTVNYPEIDQGRTRFEENEARKLRNLVRAQEQLALNGPTRPEDMPPMERVAQASLRLDGRYREAMRSGELPADDGDPISAVIRGHMAEREQLTADQRKPNELIIHSELLPPVNGYGSSAGPFGDDELKRRKEEFEKLKALPGGAQLLRARDYLNALTWERGEPAPTDEDLQAYLAWAEANRIPLGKEGRQRAADRREPESDDPKERAPRRDAADLVAGAGLAVFDKIADSLETLFDGRSAQQIEREEKIMSDKRTIEQITEQQQRQREDVEAAKWRQIELELYLAQRDRERHIDRGR